MNPSDFSNPEALQDDTSDHIRARVAWYYFAAGLTQQEIAGRLGITRLRVNKIVGQLRTDGSVKIDIRIPLARCVELEERLKARYGLTDARVVPFVSDGTVLQRVIGEAAGTMIDPLIEDGMGLGVGWGRTLSFALKNIAARRHARSWVVTLMGGLTRGSGTNTFEVSTGFAKALGSECYYLAAPIYFPTAESRAALTSHYGISEALRHARNADIAFVSCGDLSDRSLLVGTQTVSENLESLKAAGAVGDLLGVFLDASGQPVDHLLNQRTMAISPMELKAIPDSILASGGLHKAPIIKAILSCGHVRRIVTDEECAAAIL
ncbi:MAG: DNA-binding transcriptional regulator [Rhizobiales bacterium 63-22]|nr:MAG: DNA-binding transcriptional regulator [Rhizobiales bacterium 63-22]